ncbi:hypothetical protein KCH_23810 [Kitasatospora cheerisanensis KCTC 2395]|uniref:Uncharacterized protein n=1 Tax=Kitasatospora cheerisanensis KCTC 2395 TaxID=1348663 RepID=A0A066Z6R7_9ACTN|nr:hypothetical protein KCH_23810 [Kitasatospora cheerisanensis KCTC 2395]
MAADGPDARAVLDRYRMRVGADECGETGVDAGVSLERPRARCGLAG